MTRSARAYAKALVKVWDGEVTHLEKSVTELVELVQSEERQADIIGKLMIQIDECLEESQLPDNYVQVNAFYVDNGFDDPYEAACRMQEMLELTRLEIAKLHGAVRSFKRLKEAMRDE